MQQQTEITCTNGSYHTICTGTCGLTTLGACSTACEFTKVCVINCHRYKDSGICNGFICNNYAKTNNCNNACPFLIIQTNVEMSGGTIAAAKNKITREAIETLKNTIYSDIKPKYLFNNQTEEQYKEYFKKLSGSTLSLSEQKLLLEQIKDDFTRENALNLYMNAQNTISISFYGTLINRDKLKEIITKTIKNVVINIILSYNYTEIFLQFNYSSAYQSMYYATSLYLYKFKWAIIKHIFDEYTVDQQLENKE